MFCYDGYATGYSYVKKIPVWTSYVITNRSANFTNVERGEWFAENEQVPRQHRSKHSDYTRSGYDRGHMAPSGSIDFSRQANDQTFFMTNIAPQLPGFNRDMYEHDGAWGKLEHKVREWVTERQNLYVMAGTIASGRKTIGRGIAVPEAFFKVVLDMKTGEALAFLFPHKEGGADRLESFLTSIDSIESHSGLDLFANIVDSQEDAFESQTANGLW